MRAKFRARSAAEIEQKKNSRAEKSKKRQELRQLALIQAAARNDQAQVLALTRKINAADMAAKMHKPEQSEARKERLQKLSDERDVRAWEVAAKAKLPARRDEFSRFFMPTPCGKRDGAKLVAASPHIQLLIASFNSPSERADRAYNAMREAVILEGGDRRKHPLHHAVVAGDQVHDDLVERAMLLMVAAGGDIDRDEFVVIEHQGEGSEQGRHAHLAWIGRRDAGHSGAAVAARAWAAAAGAPEAAQKPSLGTGAASGRDWANIGLVGERISKAVELGRLGIPSNASAAGLFLYKGSWSAGDALGGKSVRGKEVQGAIAHLFGRD